MSDLLSYAVNVKSAIGLAAFALGAVVWLWHRKLQNEQKLIASAPEAERAKLVEAHLTGDRYRMERDNLTREQKFQLVSSQLATREKQTRYAFMLAAFVCVLLTGLVAIELIRGDKGQAADVGLNLPPQGAITEFDLGTASVQATIANQGTFGFSVARGELQVACPGEERVAIPLTAGAATPVAANASVKATFDAIYQRFKITLPQTSQCDLALKLTAATGTEETTLEASKPRSSAGRGRDHVTLFNFSAPDADAQRVSEEYAQAVQHALVQVSQAADQYGSDVELLRMQTDAPQIAKDVEEVQRMSRSLLVASGTVIKEGTDSLVQAKMYIPGSEPELKRKLSDFALPYGPPGSFKQARQLNEIAVNYSLAKALARRSAPITSIVAYLRAADNVAQDLLKSKLPDELSGLVQTWSSVLHQCLEKSISNAKAADAGGAAWCG